MDSNSTSYYHTILFHFGAMPRIMPSFSSSQSRSRRLAPPRKRAYIYVPHLGVIALFALSIYSLTLTLTVTIKVHNESLQNTVNTHNFDLPSHSIKKGDQHHKTEGNKGANNNNNLKLLQELTSGKTKKRGLSTSFPQ